MTEQELLSEREALWITRALMLGASHHYDDYGHPERASVRQYHTYRGPHRLDPEQTVVVYGYTQARAARHWLVCSTWASQFRQDS